MFTGIVSRSHRVQEIRPGSDSQRLVLERVPVTDIEHNLQPWNDLERGESIAVNGVCLTLVSAPEGPHLAFDVVQETLRRSTLGDLQVGLRVHLERALRMGDRLGGHYVTGHVDATGRVSAVKTDGDETILRIQVDVGGSSGAGVSGAGVSGAGETGSGQFDTIAKGSVTLDGVSLTVVDPSPGQFSVALIPHTLQVTTLGERQVGDRVNLEMDHFGKWVQHLMSASL